MVIQGLKKFSLLDYPGKMACTIFTAGCNFRCPYCYYKPLVMDTHENRTIPVEEVYAFLEKYQGILDGVCLTGGEPLIQHGVEEFLKHVKELGYAVKLETNGSFPDKLKRIVSEGLVSYVAMDIKNGPTHYGETSGCPDIDLAPIRESVDFLKHWDKPYEFRTTVVRELHCAQDFEEIGTWLAGASQYFLQNYVDSENVLQPGFTSCTKEELLSFAAIVKPYVKQVSLRGVD